MLIFPKYYPLENCPQELCPQENYLSEDCSTEERLPSPWYDCYLETFFTCKCLYHANRLQRQSTWCFYNVYIYDIPLM